MAVRLLPSTRLRRMLDDRLPPRVVDVRSRDEFDQLHLPGAVNIPLEELAQRAAEIDPMVDLVVVSEHGIRSSHACAWLVAHGYAKVMSLLGGMSEFRFPQD